MSVNIWNDERRVLSFSLSCDKAEFEEIAMQAYSDDYNLKRAAYNKMCFWRTRFRLWQLPFEVTGTMKVLEAQLNDNEYRAARQRSLGAEEDIRQHYFNAILWYLARVCEGRGSYRSFMTRLKITEWVVNLANSDTLVPLDWLRTAAQITLRWLIESYWRPQALAMEDYMVKAKVKFATELSDVAYFLKIWLCVRVYELGGIERINQLPNEELRLELLALLTFWYDSDDHEVPSNSHTYNDPELHKLKDVMQRLLSEISHYLETAKTVVKKSIIYKLVENRGFLSSDVFLEEESPVNVMEGKIISVLATLWYDVLKMMDSKYMIFYLLETLVKITQSNGSVHRSRMAALWVAQLTKMVSQPHIDSESNIKNVYMLSEFKNLAFSLENNLCAGVYPILLDYFSAAVDTKLPMLSLQPLKGLSMCYLVKLGKEIVRDPNKFTLYILPSLLDCCGEHLPKKIREVLLIKVGIYTNKPKNEGSGDLTEDANSNSVETPRAQEESTKHDTDCFCYEDLTEDINTNSVETIRTDEEFTKHDTDGCCSDDQYQNPESESKNKDGSTNSVLKIG